MMRNLRLGIIGWGYWGPKIARNLQNLTDTMVTIIADTDVNRLDTIDLNYHQFLKRTTQVQDTRQRA